MDKNHPPPKKNKDKKIHLKSKRKSQVKWDNPDKFVNFSLVKLNKAVRGKATTEVQGLKILQLIIGIEYKYHKKNLYIKISIDLSNTLQNLLTLILVTNR